MAQKGDLHVTLDLSELEKLGEDFKELEGRLNQEVAKLAAQTHAHILEQAQTKLHSRRQKFVENLKFEQVSDGLWVVTIQEPAIWIEDGMPAHSMVKDLLGDHPKQARDGSQYRVIPFEHDKGSTQQTAAQTSLTDTIKQELKKLNVPYKKIERDEKGRPKTGLLHKFDITDRPTKTGEGPGQGHGPVGAPKQGVDGTPWLKGIRIYQKALFNPDGTPKMDKHGLQKAQRSIMTFRVVSSKHEGERWKYPGIEGMGFLDEAMEWAEKEWNERIIPDILKSLDIKAG